MGIEAVSNKKGNPYSLIFMDIHMPVMDGLEATRHLTDMGITTPIVALTANAMSKDIEIYLACGICDYLAKPFVARDLWKCLLKFLTPMLRDFNMQCFDLLPQISEIPSPFGDEAYLLEKQMGDCDFDLALETVRQIRSKVFG